MRGAALAMLVVRCTVAVLTLSALASLTPGVQAQTDLSGTWTDGAGNTFVLTQNGANIVILVPPAFFPWTMLAAQPVEFDGAVHNQRILASWSLSADQNNVVFPGCVVDSLDRAFAVPFIADVSADAIDGTIGGYYATWSDCTITSITPNPLPIHLTRVPGADLTPREPG